MNSLSVGVPLVHTHNIGQHDLMLCISFYGMSLDALQMWRAIFSQVITDMRDARKLLLVTYFLSGSYFGIQV
eukprot:c33029_g1_i1 orf=3-215(-)